MDDDARAALFRLLPRAERSARFADLEALRLEGRGLDIDAVERELFNGLPPDASRLAVRKLYAEVGFEKLADGTRALLAAEVDAFHAAWPRAHAAATMKRAEAARFGATFTRSILEAAGWAAEELADD